MQRYLVELIILKNKLGSETNTEIWDRFPVTQSARDTGFGSTPPTAAEDVTHGTREPGGAHTLPLEVIPTALHHLASALRLLQLGDQFQVIKHGAWIQPLTG
ncbi:MAG: hypothetical protein R3330_20065, partial [Saprospiraceae bacterium]|nr:hypothetical protein [Saprospiraceae bacterium]